MWSEKKLKALLAAGKIRGYSIPKKVQSARGSRKISKEKAWIAEILLTWCNERALILREEYRFHQVRKWRFDWCIPSLKVAFEYEGIYSKKSRHTNQMGYSKDTEKYNAAVALGWRVFRYTASTYLKLEKDLKACE